VAPETPPLPGRTRLALGLYGVAGALLAPLALPLLGLHPRLSGGLWQRLGRWRVEPTDRPPVWLHGSSAGDVAALAPLGGELAAVGHSLVVSAWTRSGHQMALRRRWGEPAPQIFRVPLDLPFVVRGVLRRVRPSMVVLECLEIWPNLVLACQRRGIPVAVVNGRLSRRSAARYARARWLFGPCFEGLSLVTALTSHDAERFVSLGVPPRRVTVESSSKHGAAARCRPSAVRQKKLVLGSIHAEEEAHLLPWVSRLLRELPDLRVEVAPRYPHRAGAILRWFSLRGVRGVALSRQPDRGPRPPLLVHDAVGGLASSYSGAGVAFVGGSLNGHGGHNVVEPAARSVPVLTGPHTDHCREEVRLLIEAGGAWRVDGGEAFYRLARRLLERPEEAARRGGQARRVALCLGASSTRIAARLQALLG